MADTTYLDFIDGVKAYYGSGSDQWAEIAKYGLKADNALNILKQVPDVEIIKNANGSVRGITYKGFTTMGGYSGGDTDKLNQILNGINSNTIGGTANPSKSINMKIPSNTKVNEVTKELEMTSEIGKKVSTGQKVLGALGTIGQAVFAVGTACTLGKRIDKTLYNLNPDFWNAHDMETLNPDVWGEITNSGSIGDNIFNALMGVDPVTNETTAYVDQNALAYMAWYLQNKDIFSTETSFSVNDSDVSSDDKSLLDNFSDGVQASISNNIQLKSVNISNKYIWNYKSKSNRNVKCFVLNQTKQDSSFYDIPVMVDEKIFKWDMNKGWNTEVDFPSTLNEASSLGNYNDKNFYYGKYDGGGQIMPSTNVHVNTVKTNISSNMASNIACYLLMKYGKEHEKNIDGVSTQDGVTVPDLSGANSLDDVLNILKNTLPNVFNNAITNSVPQPDGTIKDYTYVPITLPNTNNNNDPQPDTGNQTQAKPQVNPETSPDTLLDLIIKLIGNKLDTPNPPDTGTGNTPPVILPTGSANALYKIYNPTQAEINSFGAWLWSSNFVDQLLKVFNNPMESIIGLHKVYASPIIGGRSNIKVGYLDSGVNSNFVSNQYTKIDCGTVNLQEYFGNVFDYSPYTNIELYLPCIGFVQLDVGNVMRSSINITYTVDVLTGACIAEVNVKRDGSGGVLYSYSGNCASQYPLSSGSYMGIVSSVIGVAGSIVGTVASGGSLAPLALGATSGLLNAKTHVQHSGSLSGNSGVMGGKIPYLIITRPQTNMAENYQHLQGIPSNTYTQLSACHGFVKVKNVNVQNIIAESGELEEIKTLLLDGVII